MRIRTSTILLFLALCSLSACTKTTAELAIPDLFPRSGDSTSAEFTKARESVAKLRADIQQHPDRIKNYTDLAQIFIQESRVSGRHHEYYPIASRLLDEALTRDPQSFEALLLRAGMQMTMHRFAEAKKTITGAITVNNSNSGAYGVLADANTELGLYVEAVKAVDKMMSARPDLRSYARASYQRELRGDLDGALAAMRMAVDAGAYGQESREWSVYQYGNLFLQSGKPDTAAFLYNGILEERPNYAYALSGLAMVAAGHNDYPTAIGYLVKASQVLPEHLFVEQLSDVYLAMGDTANARLIEEKVLQAFEQHEADGWNVNRELALYCANHNIRLDESLRRAEADYTTRPDNIDALDTYAWVLFKNNRATEASKFLERALRMHPLNPTYYYHASAIENAIGNHQAAAAYAQLCRYLPPICHSTLLATTIK